MVSKSRVERLVEALKQDDFDWIDLDEHDLGLDGRWDRQALEGALATAFPDPPAGVVIQTTVEEPGTLFMREGWVSGEAEDGTKVSLEKSFATILFRMTKPDGTVILHSLHVGDLLQKWANWADPS